MVKLQEHEISVFGPQTFQEVKCPLKCCDETFHDLLTPEGMSAFFSHVAEAHGSKYKVIIVCRICGHKENVENVDATLVNICGHCYVCFYGRLSDSHVPDNEKKKTYKEAVSSGRRSDSIISLVCTLKD